jgi:hypothetical protein
MGSRPKCGIFKLLHCNREKSYRYPSHCQQRPRDDAVVCGAACDGTRSNGDPATG